MIIAFFQIVCYRKKGTWDAKNFKTHFSYKISLCLWIIFGSETLKHTHLFLEHSVISYSVVTSHFWHLAKPTKPKKKYMQTHTYTINVYTEAHTWTLNYKSFLNRGLKLMMELNLWTAYMFPKSQYLRAQQMQ